MTMLRRKNKLTKDKLNKLMSSFVIAPVIGIVLGIFLVSKFFIPFLDNNDIGQEVGKIDDSLIDQDDKEKDDKDQADKDQGDKSTVEYKELGLDDFNLYNVQVGSFSSLENAKIFLEEINNKKLGGYILKINDYKIFIGSYLDRTDAESVLKNTKEIYPEAFISEKIIETLTLKYVEEDEEYIDDIAILTDKVIKTYNSESIKWENVLKNSQKDDIIKLIDKNNDEIQQLLNKLNNIKSDEVKYFISSITDNLSKRRELFNGDENIALFEIYVKHSKAFVNYLNILIAD